MTEILLVCTKDKCFKHLTAKGHASFAEKGKDIVCAAETMLLRTSMEVLEQTEGVILKTDKSSRGNLEFFVEDFTVTDKDEILKIKERLRCTADYLRNGLYGLSQEYPNNVRFQEITED